MKRSSVVKLAVLALIPLFLGISGGEPTSVSFRLARLSEPFVEPVTGWMVQNTFAKLFGREGVPASAEQVRDYFTAVGSQLRTGSQAPAAAAGPARTASPGDAGAASGAPAAIESAIQQSIAFVAARDDLDRTVAGFEFVFPPVVFRFETLPSLLVVSPRTKIERETTVLLRPDLDPSEMAQIESRTGGQDTSTLVTTIGGLGIYPSMVPLNSNPRWTFRTVAHEWTHQFLTLTPLGWRYALGGEGDSRIITINETVAEVVGQELGDQAYREFYPDGATQEGPRPAEQDAFRREMRDIRTKVDAMLAAGQVQEAEDFMETSRQLLTREGFYIRKLNQAYFAFYGSYADDPSSAGRSGQEISRRVHELRAASGSLGAFLQRVSAASSYQDFQRITDAP